MHANRPALMFAAGTALAGLAWAGEPAKLDKADLEKTLTGKSMNYANINGSSATVIFDKDGRVTYKTGNSKASVGTWQAGEDGRYCIKIATGSAQDHCRRLWKTDTGYAVGGANGEFIPVSGLD